MIQRLGSCSLSFKGNDVKSARDAYNERIDKNNSIAKKQTELALSPADDGNSSTCENGKKLNVIA